MNFAHASEASKANFHENKRIIYRLPFMKKVYMTRFLDKREAVAGKAVEG